MEVYFALNTITGKAYVGWTKDTAPVRFKVHCKEARRGSHLYFHRAIRKYGPDAFSVLTVWKGDDAEEMKQVERNYIAGMRTNDSQRGYNLTAGGDGALGHKHSEETRRKMVENRLPMTEACRTVRRQTMQRQWDDPEFRSKRHAGQFGHGVSDEGRQNMSAAQKGKPRWTTEEKARIKEQRASQVITAEHKAKTSASLTKYRQEHPESYEGFNSFAVQSRGGRKSTHMRWHTQREIVEPTCEFCLAGRVRQFQKSAR